ncbi:MAG: hypothetical protein RLZZ112_471 [Verrucomicrobiota bacterium]
MSPTNFTILLYQRGGLIEAAPPNPNHTKDQARGVLVL